MEYPLIQQVRMFAKHLKGFLQFGIFVQKNRASTVCQYRGQCYKGVLTSFVGYTDFLIYSDLNNGRTFTIVLAYTVLKLGQWKGVA